MTVVTSPHRSFTPMAAAKSHEPSTSQYPEVIPTDGREEKPGRVRQLIDLDRHPRYRNKGLRGMECND